MVGLPRKRTVLVRSPVLLVLLFGCLTPVIIYHFLLNENGRQPTNHVTSPLPNIEDNAAAIHSTAAKINATTAENRQHYSPPTASWMKNLSAGIPVVGQDIHFRTYGNDVYAEAKMRRVSEANETGWFKTAKAFGPDDLSRDFQERYKEILSLPRGGGYWIWKFYLINSWMDALEEGDILVYLDAGTQINKRGEKRFFEYVKMINGSPYDVLGFQLHPLMTDYKWTTTRLLNAFNVTEDPEITHTAQFEGGTLVIQKGSHFRKWMKLCWDVLLSDPLMITDEYNEETRKINPVFKENRHDQSIMSVSRKLLGCVRIDGFESKGAKPDMPFHVHSQKRV